MSSVPRPVPPSPLITLQEAAAYLNVGRTTLGAWAREKPVPRVPSVELGSRRLFRLADIEAIVARGGLPDRKHQP